MGRIEILSLSRHYENALYWPAPQMVLSTRKGMHRFSWDLHFDPIGDEPRAGGGGTGAVPHRTYPRVRAPWAPPGEYTVRLTVNGEQFSQPLSLRLDPRVKTSAEDLARVASLSREMYDGAVAANAAYEEARALVAELDAAGNRDAMAEVEALAPAPQPRSNRRFRRSAPTGPPTLASVSEAMMDAAMAMQAADVAPTMRMIAACDTARAQFEELMSRWSALKTSSSMR